jgi:hypothetical protein
MVAEAVEVEVAGAVGEEAEVGKVLQCPEMQSIV